MKKVLVISMLCASTLLLEGCAPRIGGSNYSVRGAGEMNDTYRGVVVSARPVTISAKTAERENEPGAGALAGGLAAGYAGSQIGKGHGSVVAAGVGALAGAIGGHFAEKALTDQEGFEYQVRLDDGRLTTIAQGADPVIRVGQRVLVIKSTKDRGRIIPDNSGY
ncbi:glycine zipper 2TM domain-containing protein [Candidatus Paracaedibacter symbiosus]|uniref:glycine zipper 2TM domain-containing protein n=1 Tax=Candidatus Paracaedibacter symbiosus TaxID=244582 RepID=UPI0012EBC8F0|nr:glycine zipper 2TM domain-containing protein [Candidatus Paracaedibacter symbiosus]